LPLRKKRNHKSLCFQGLKLDVSLAIAKISKHQYYYQLKNTKQGLSPSLSSVYIGLDGVEMTILNTEIIALMRLINQDLDTDYGHRKMTAALKLIGYQINHKKLYRLKETQMLKGKHENPVKHM
jgi:hypothetical protein